MAPSTSADCESLPDHGKNHMIGTEASSEYPTEAANSPLPLAANSREPVKLENAFLAITEELTFDLPEPSRVDRITAGLMEAMTGLLCLLLT
jgi:hypothetical protein